MTNKIKIVIELEYTITESELKMGKSDLEDYVEDMVYDDLTDLMRGDRLRTWATVESMETVTA
jgi:hypothetical protein